MAVTVHPNAEWLYWDAVMQVWKSLPDPPTSGDDIMVNGVDADGYEVAIYFRTDRKGSWLGGTNG